MKERSVIGIIPARYESTRFPGKPLALLDGLPLIQHVYERAGKARVLTRLLVATDDRRIADCVKSFGGKFVMTSGSCASGTDRAAEAVTAMDADIVVNIQGDEPFIDPEGIDTVAGILVDRPHACMGTLVAPLDDTKSLMSPHTAKVILNERGEALYFSRQPIPHMRGKETDAWTRSHNYYRHVGLYSYTKDFLIKFAGWGPSSLEEAEKLEQLRALEHGVIIHTALTKYHPQGIDTPEDLEQARKRVGVFLGERKRLNGKTH